MPREPHVTQQPPVDPQLRLLPLHGTTTAITTAITITIGITIGITITTASTLQLVPQALYLLLLVLGLAQEVDVPREDGGLNASTTTTTTTTSITLYTASHSLKKQLVASSAGGGGGGVGVECGGVGYITSWS